MRVELLSGLVKRTAKQLDEIRADITAGHVQVAVGTHALLSDKITFANLGLLVVDEEQRFGVKQKEKIKTAAKTVDVLTLSATPIPRTMYMVCPRLSIPRPPGHAASAGSSRAHDLWATLPARAALDPTTSESRGASRCLEPCIT